MDDYKETELCKGCIFNSLCNMANLPHCEGLDYIKDRGQLDNGTTNQNN